MIRLLKEVHDLRNRPALLFDLDGTLANTLPMIVATASKVLLETGMTEEELGDVSRLVGPPFPQAFTHIYGMSMEEAVGVTARYREEYDHLGREAWPLFEGVDTMLAQLRAAGKKLGVASSKKADLVMQTLADNGLADTFDVICGKLNDTSYFKTDAMKDALAALRARPADALMVGDRMHDAHAANELGIPCIGVLWGGAGSFEELRDAGCVAVVDTVDELTDLLLA